MIVLIVCCVSLFVLYIFFTRKNPKPIFGVYTQPSRWFPVKYMLFLLIYYLRTFLTRYFAKGKRNQSTGFGVHKNLTDVDLDRPQPLINHIKAFDAVFFIGANPQGYYFTMGAERRQNHVINGLFYLVVPGRGLLCSSRLPDTVLLGARENQYGAEGILMTPVEAMKKWRLRFKGSMWSKVDPEITYSVKFTAEWTSKSKYFNYDTDLHPHAVARAVAREQWTREYFDMIKSAHQSRYEQMGETTVKLTIEDEVHEFTTQSFRDHGFGAKRDWFLMHRYAFFHIFLDNGMMAAVGVVSQPCTVTSMETGFVQEPDGTIYPIEWCDLQLYQHGEGGIPPSDHGFQFKAGQVVYRAQVQVVYENTHYVGWDWEAKMVERFVRFTVNGIQGQGVSEFHYRHREGRPAILNAEDPQWFQVLRQHYIYS